MRIDGGDLQKVNSMIRTTEKKKAVRFQGHRGSALHGIEVTAGRAETTVAAERNKF